MNLENIFSTKERVKILKKIIYLEDSFGVNEVAKKLGLSKGLISKYFEILVKEKVLEKVKRKFAVKNNSNVKSIRVLLNIQKINSKIFKKYFFINAVGLYGSCSKGTNTESSDIDLWVKIEKASEDDIAKFTTEIRTKIENVKILVLDDEKINLLKKKDPPFYNSLHFGSIILYGKENEI